MLALSWSGGKDSALALRALCQEHGTTPAALLTTVNEDYGRVSMHGVRCELVQAQADAAGVPLVEVGIPAACPNDVYEARMAHALAIPPLEGVGTMAFVDLSLKTSAPIASSGSRPPAGPRPFPLLRRDTGALAREFTDANERADLAGGRASSKRCV